MVVKMKNLLFLLYNYITIITIDKKLKYFYKITLKNQIFITFSLQYSIMVHIILFKF